MVFSNLEGVDPEWINIAADRIQRYVDDLEDGVEIDISWEISDIESQADSLADTVRSAREALREFVAFVKTFSDDEFATVYCEREWRALKPYNFNYDDLAMIVIPRRVGKQKYFDKFIGDFATKLRLPRSIPVVPWEDLVEH